MQTAPNPMAGKNNDSSETGCYGNRIYRWLYWGCVAALFAAGAWARFKLPLTPLSDPDTFGYLYPALDCLAGKGFEHVGGRAYVYPAFLLGLLRLFGDFRAIAAAQHLIGLGGGWLLLIAWRQFNRLLPGPVIFFFLRDGLGLSMLAIYMLGRIPINFEHQIRPEAITGAFAAANLCLTMAFIRFRFFSRRSPHDLIAGGLLLLNSFVLFALKPSFVLTMLFATSPVWISLFRKEESSIRKIILVVPALIACWVLWLPEHRLAQKDKVGQMFFSETLFTIHARQIAEQMESDLASGVKIPYDRAWLGKIIALLKEEIANSTSQRTAWITLGFNPDHLLYDDSICRQIDRERRRPYDRRQFYYYWYLHTFRRQPFTMLLKISREMGQFFALGNAYRDYPAATTIGGKYAQSATAFRSYPESITKLPMGVEYLSECAALSPGSAPLAEPEFIRLLLVVLAYAYLPLLIASVAAAVASLAIPALRIRYGMPALILLLLYSYNFGNCISTAVVHSLSVVRYIRTQFVFTLFTEFAAALFLAEVCLFVWNVRNARQAGTIARVTLPRQASLPWLGRHGAGRAAVQDRSCSSPPRER